MSETFDPLGSTDPKALATAIKQRVRNIIRSYNHPSDMLSEPLQNAVDEIDEAVASGVITRGSIAITIDCATGRSTIADNGRGIDVESVKRMLAPDVTGKAELFRNGRSRGHKGVGLTFLAYGFNFFELESRTTTEHFSVRIENARRWVEDVAITTVPSAILTMLGTDEGVLRAPGTVVAVQVSDQTEPRNLHRTFPNKEFTRTVLETQTAVGVYPRALPAEAPIFDAKLDYISQDGSRSSTSITPSYRFPHMALKQGVKAFDVGKYLATTNDTVPAARLTKKNEAVYRFYTTDQLVEMLRGRANGDLIESDADSEALLRKHSATAYGLAGYSAAYKGTLSDSWFVPANRKLISPSMRVATDRMISSWQRDLSLTHRGFNVERIWLIVHLEGVEPDLGRKDYPPQILELIGLLEDPLADDVAKQGEVFLVPTTRSGKMIDYQNPSIKAHERLKSPFSPNLPSTISNSIRYLSQPMEEQDVVALFNELRGLGVLSYLAPVFFSSSYVYDSYLHYEPDDVPTFVSECLPGADAASLAMRLREGVAEFKYNATDIILDLVRELKSWNEITWLVCWEASPSSRSIGGMTIDLVEVEPGDDPYAGVTHVATLSTAGEVVVHVISLKRLLEKIVQTAGA